MSPEELDRRARALFGPHWQLRLATGLGRNSRTIRRQAAGEIDVQPDVVAVIELLELLLIYKIKFPPRWLPD